MGSNHEIIESIAIHVGDRYRHCRDSTRFYRAYRATSTYTWSSKEYSNLLVTIEHDYVSKPVTIQIARSKHPPTKPRRRASNRFRRDLLGGVVVAPMNQNRVCAATP